MYTVAIECDHCTHRHTEIAGHEDVNSPQTRTQSGLSEAKMEQTADHASSIFVIGKTSMPSSVSKDHAAHRWASEGMPFLSSKATIGRNSQFYNLTRQDRNELGGIEYRSLKLLLKVVSGKIFVSPEMRLAVCLTF